MALSDAPGAHPEHTYIRRRGRLTKAQARGLELCQAHFRGDVDMLVKAEKPLGIEIGFGMGWELLAWAEAAPDWQLAGIELYQPGIGSLCAQLAERNLSNVCVLAIPAQNVLAALPDDAVDEYRIFFPDPWPKKRHAKRRLIQPEFVALLARTLAPGGRVRLATDWSPYAEWMRECFATCEMLTSELDQVRAPEVAGAADVARETTKFESRGERLGHTIHDLVYVRG